MKKYLFLSAVIGAMLTACSGSSAQSSSSSQLKLVAPQSYLANPGAAVTQGGIANQDAIVNSGISSMPVIIKNPSNVEVTGIKYSYKLNDTHLNQADIPDNCATIAANSSCQLNIPISSDVVPGNIQIEASVNGVDILSNVIGFSDVTPNAKSGANSVLLYSDDKIFATSGSTTSFMVTAVVESVGAIYSNGTFNAVVLADGNGKKIPYCHQISGPTGGIISVSVLTYLCDIPSNLTRLELAPQLVNMSSSTNQPVGQNSLNATQDFTIVNAGVVQKSIRIVSPTEKLSYIVQSPEQISLNQSNQSQVIQVSNKGNIADTISKIQLSNSNITIVNDGCSGKSIAPNGGCAYELKLDSTESVAGVALSQLVLANTNSIADSAINIRYVGTSVLVDVIILAKDLNFVTNAGSPIETQSVTLTNNSKLAITPQLPDLTPGKGYFSVSAPAVGMYCYGGMQLESNQSCSFNISYTNKTDVDLSSFNLSLPFSYSYAGATQIYTSVLNVHYVTDNFAHVDISDGADNLVSELAFKTIHNNMIESSEQVVSLYNSGSTKAIGISAEIDPSANSLFSIVNNTCGLILDSGRSCQITIKFGPTATTANEYKSNLIIGYSSGGTVLQTLLPLSGTVLMPMSANITGVITASTFNGSGSESNHYVVEQNTGSVPSVTYSFTNIGNSVGESINAVLESAASGWSIAQDNCSGKSLAVKASCEVILNLNDTTVLGSRNLNLANLVISWTDQDSPAGIANEQVGTIFADVVTAPKIAIDLQATAGLQKTTESQLSYLVESSSSYILNLNLSGGISSHTVTVNVSQATGSASLSPSGECTLSPSASTCQITIKTGDNQIGNGDFTVSFSSDVPLSQSSINFHTWSGALPSASVLNGSTSFAINKGFLYNAVGADIYRCSVLSNGYVYSCINVYMPNNTNPLLPETIQQLAFVGSKLYASNSPLISVSPFTARFFSQWQVGSDGTLSNYLTDLPEYTLSVGGGDTSGITSFAIYESTIYFTQFNGIGLWVCPLNSQLSTTCKLNAESGSNFQGNAASLIVGNYLYITQTYSRLNRGLNKCLINSDGSIDSCTNISPTVPGDTQSFDGSQYSSSLSYIGGYLYGNQGGGSSTPGSDVCPFDGSKITGNCFLASAPLSDITSMVSLDKWVYFASANGSGKALQSADGKLTSVTSIIGY